MVEGIGERFREDIGEGRWLTYTELAEIRGIGRESAVKLAQRERWRKLSGNSPDRTVRVLVPPEWLKPAKGGQIGEGFPEGIGELSRLMNGLQDTVALVRERAEAAEARADAADADRRAAEVRAEAERARADQAEEDRRAAESRASAADADRRMAEERAHIAERDRQEAVALAEKTAAMLTDARARTEEARQHDAALIADLQAKDAQAAGLRDRLVGAQAELALAQRAATETRERLQRVQDAAEALREAEEARKARGRWARLRAAWRGM